MKKASFILLLQLFTVLSLARDKWTFVENTTVDEVYANGSVIKTRSGDFYVVNSTFPSSQASRSDKVRISQSGNEFKLVFDRTDSVFCEQVTRVIEDQLDEEYKGPEDRTIYKLRHEGLWQQDGYTRISRYGYTTHPLLLIYYHNHEWTMAISGSNETMAVKKLSSNSGYRSIFESSIEGNFDGWQGETTVKLSNGETWQQAGYSSSYGSARNPSVTVYESESDGYMMVIHGMSGQTRVKRIN